MLRIVLAVLLGVSGACSSEPKARDLVRSDQVAAAGSLTIRPLREMTEVSEFSQLRQFGVTAPEERDHEAGTNLILLTMKATIVGKGEWLRGYGIVGTEMLSVDLNTRLGYQTLFDAGPSCALSALPNRQVANNASLLLGDWYVTRDDSGALPNHVSLIARRQTAIAAIATSIADRFRWDLDGNYGRVLTSAPKHQAAAKLRRALTYGIRILQEFETVGYKDLRLQGSLGAATAVLRHDGISPSLNELVKVKQSQVYADALNAAVGRLRASIRRGGDLSFEEALCTELESRELPPSGIDQMFLPASPGELEVLLKVVRDDLATSMERGDRSPQ